jgi:hypothetical protein
MKTQHETDKSLARMDDNYGRIMSLDRDQEMIMPGHGVDAQRYKRIGGGFFRGKDCSFMPNKLDFDRDGLISKYVLKGWTPERPLISKTTKVTAFGSCFADHIGSYLSSRGYNLSKDRAPTIYVSRMSEGMVNTYAILQQFQWAFEGTKPEESLWHGYKGEQFGYDDEVRKSTEQIFLDSEIFIITLGLSEIWYDELTGGVFWRAVPMKFYDESRHKFRVSSFEETKRNIQKTYSLIREHVSAAKVLFTLSPIPLAATFRPESVITANSASKAILRAALDEFFRENSRDLNRDLFYFPSFEIVNDLFDVRFASDFRHPRDNIFHFIMQLFEAIYCQEGSPTDVDALFRQARHVDEPAIALKRVPRTVRNLIRFFSGQLKKTELG